MDAFAQQLHAGKLYLRQPINQLLPPSLLLYLVPPFPSLRIVVVFFFLALLVLLRLWLILPSRRTRHASSLKSSVFKQHTLAVFLGSGGHTTELLQLVSALPTDRYPRRIYLVSSGDNFSLNKANDLERKLSTFSGGPLAKVLHIPRARKVHQSFLTTPLSLARSLLFCLDHVAIRPSIARRMLADVVIMNGPGTCVPIVAAVYLLRVSLSP